MSSAGRTATEAADADLADVVSLCSLSVTDIFKAGLTDVAGVKDTGPQRLLHLQALHLQHKRCTACWLQLLLSFLPSMALQFRQ